MFTKARVFVRNLKLKSESEWRQYAKSGNKPEDIPTNPNVVYKDTGWVSIGDWLGTGTIAPKNREYRVFTKARGFARSLKLKSGSEWKAYCKSGNKPDDIPAKPDNGYKDKGWISMGDWLGTNRSRKDKDKRRVRN